PGSANMPGASMPGTPNACTSLHSKIRRELSSEAQRHCHTTTGHATKCRTLLFRTPTPPSHPQQQQQASANLLRPNIHTRTETTKNAAYTWLWKLRRNTAG